MPVASENNGKATASRARAVIRLATVEDLPAVVDGIVAMLAETIWALAPQAPDRAYLLQWLLKTLSTDPRYRLFVAEQAGTLIGLAGGELLTHRFDPSLLFVQEWAVWVAPGHRHEQIGHRLWKAVLTWAKSEGAQAAVYAKAMRVKDLKQPRAFEKLVMTKLENVRQ